MAETRPKPKPISPELAKVVESAASRLSPRSKSGGGSTSTQDIQKAFAEALDKSGGNVAPATDDPLVWDGTKKRPRSQVYADLYRMDDQMLRAFQEKAFNAGLYGTAKRSEVRFGDLDADTEQVWRGLTNRAVGFTTVGRNVSPTDALDLAIGAAQRQPDVPEVVKTMNPLDIRGIARAAFQKTLGYVPDDAALESFAAEFGAAIAGTDTMSGAGGTGQAELAGTLARNMDPVKADARRSVAAFDTIAKMFKEG